MGEGLGFVRLFDEEVRWKLWLLLRSFEARGLLWAI